MCHAPPRTRRSSPMAFLIAAPRQFKPYLVDGQPVPVVLIAPCTLDGRPFAAMFQQPHALDASEFEDYLEGGGTTDGIQSGAPRARRGRR